ncbi:hypothetical protein [Nocardia sp. NPDC004722]
MTDPNPPAEPKSQARFIKFLLVTICALISVIVGLTAGILTYRAGSSWSATVIPAAGAFASALGLSILVLNTLWEG